MIIYNISSVEGVLEESTEDRGWQKNCADREWCSECKLLTAMLFMFDFVMVWALVNSCMLLPFVCESSPWLSATYPLILVSPKYRVAM